MIAVRVESTREAFRDRVTRLVNLLEIRLGSGNRPELQVQLNHAADRLREMFSREIRESELYYLPIFRGLCPELAGQVAELTQEHESLSTLLDRAVRYVKDDRPREALNALQGMVWMLIDHSHHQEQVVDEVVEREAKAQDCP